MHNDYNGITSNHDIRIMKQIQTHIHALLITLLLFIVAGTAATAQGIITGSVLDRATQEPVLGATVTVLDTKFGAVTDLEGKYAIRNIPPGSYRIRVSSIGYEPVVVSDVVVDRAKPVVLLSELIETPIIGNEIVVEASYFQRPVESVVSTQTFSYEEIRRSPGGFEDVFRAISVLPGVVQVNAGRNDLIVRGGAPSENLFVVDNIEVPNINHFGSQGGTGGPLSFINLDFVRETHFSAGGFGARYGDKLSSVLTINLREGVRDAFGGKLTVSATQFGLNAESRIGDRGSFFLSARRSYLDFIFQAAGFGFVPEYWDFIGKVNYDLDAKNSLSFLSIGALDNVRFNNDTPEKRYENTRILGNDQNQYVAGLTWRHLFTKGFMTATLGRSFVLYDFLQTDSLQQPTFSNLSREGEVSLRTDVVLQPNPSVEYSFGLIGKRARIGTELTLAPFRDFSGQTISATGIAVDTISYKAAFYGQVSIFLTERLRAIAGLRADYFSQIERSTYLAPRLSLSYRLSESAGLNASIGRFYQSPSAVWLIANPVNRTLNAIRADQIVVGGEYLPRADVKVTIEAFAKKYTDYPASVTRPYLTLANTGAGFGGSDDGYSSFGLETLTSGGSGRAFGIELLVQKKFSEIPCYGILSMTYGSSYATALDGIERASAYDQRFLFNLSGGYKFNDEWEASMKFRLTTGNPYTPIQAGGNKSLDDYNSARLPTAHALDIRVDKRWMWNSLTLITYLDVQNVYNNKIISGYRWNAFKGEIEPQENIGILPTIGISIEF